MITKTKIVKLVSLIGINIYCIISLYQNIVLVYFSGYCRDGVNFGAFCNELVVKNAFITLIFSGIIFTFMLMMLFKMILNYLNWKLAQSKQMLIISLLSLTVTLGVFFVSNIYVQSSIFSYEQEQFNKLTAIKNDSLKLIDQYNDDTNMQLKKVKLQLLDAIQSNDYNQIVYFKSKYMEMIKK